MKDRIKWCSDLDELLTVGYSLANHDLSEGRKKALRERWNRASNRFKAKNTIRPKKVTARNWK